MLYKILRGALVGMLLGASIGICATLGMRALSGKGAPDIKGMLDKISDEDVREAFLGVEEGVAGMEEYEDAVQNPQDVVVRFHVRANSDSEADIALKYEVRDAVLEAISEDLQGAENDSEAILYLSQNLSKIRNTARTVVEEAGYKYTVNAYIIREEFPIREYGELVLPAGTYRALRIDIGDAEGENFWCMLYPMMCYTVDAGAVTGSDGNEKLAESLSEEEYEKLFVKRDCENVKVKLRFVEWLQDIL